MHGVSQIKKKKKRKKNVNIFYSNYVICNLCDDYHATRTCRHAQNVDYYDEFEPFNPCFDQYDPNWDNSYVYS